jgi:hypothetical protein
VDIEEPNRQLSDTIQPRSQEPVATVGKSPANIMKSPQEEQERILSECAEYLCDSRRLRDLATLKATGNKRPRRIQPLAFIKRSSKVIKGKPLSRKYQRLVRENAYTQQIEAIDKEEIQTRRISGECLRCAWP